MSKYETDHSGEYNEGLRQKIKKMLEQSYERDLKALCRRVSLDLDGG